MRVFKDKGFLSPDEIIDDPSAHIRADWFGRALGWDLYARVSLTKTTLRFEVVTDLPLVPAAKQTQFCEGLWNTEVFELFIHSDTSKRYWEYHLSPSGDWWFSAFSDYRRVEASAGISSNAVDVLSNAYQGWNYRGIAYSPIPLDFHEGDELPILFSGILNSGNEKLYLASVPPQCGSPDFHRRDLVQIGR